MNLPRAGTAHFSSGPTSPSTPRPAGTRGLGPCGRTYQRLLAHGEHGRVGLQVHPAAAPHGLQPLHRDVLGIAQAQPHQVQHARGAPGQHPPHQGNQAASAGTPHAPPPAGTRAQARGQPGSRLLVSRLPTARFPALSSPFPGSSRPAPGCPRRRWGAEAAGSCSPRLWQRLASPVRAVSPQCRSPAATASRCWGSVLPTGVAIAMARWSMPCSNVAFVTLTQQRDLYLIHWPDAQVPGKSNREVRAETWRAMEELYEKGLCKSIGVSNFLISHLEQLKEDCVITPHVNQVEYHPFQRPQELVDYCRSRNIVFEGYCPLAKGEALTHPTVIQLAKKYGRTPAQICIRWSIQNGIVTIPKSTKAERIEENCKVFDFTITEDDVEILNGMHDGRHVSWDPSFIV
uniref:NADP-dependent oxidoreductase domain-containing protein n=2 Tax=Passerellidae TaxID=1729112 RepID=A0A8C5JS37_JUNHY